MMLDTMKFALLLCLALPATAVQEYYVSTTNGAICPNDTVCRDLSYYVNRSHLYFNTNVDAVFYFMEGAHHLSRSLVVQQASNLTLAGYEGESRVEIGADSHGVSVLRGQSIVVSRLVFYSAVSPHGNRNQLLSFENVQQVYLESVALHNVSLVVTNCPSLTIRNSSFTNVKLMIEKSMLSISNCVFSHSTKTSLLLYRSTTKLCGWNNFTSNYGDCGGAIALYLSSKLVFEDGSETSFYDNIAYEYGGAIYIDDSIHFHSHLLCFYETVGSPSVKFVGNTAGIAGSALYLRGASLQPCSGFESFGFTNHSGYSVVSSSARRACFCDSTGRPTCDVANRTVETVPGETLSISACVVGEMDGLTSGVLQIVDADSVAHQVIGKDCMSLNYTVTATDSNNLTVSTVEDDTISNVPLLVNIVVQPCPPGFNLSDGTCQCDNAIAAVADCNISDGTITRDGNVWISIDEEAGNCTIVHSGCPHGYCKRGTVTFSLSEPDNQCTSGRRGRVCGGCNGSLVLGSNECKQCHGYSRLALLVLFAFAGVALLSFLIILNLTVSVGTINGLLFYLNVLKLFEPIVFPSGPVPVLSQFVSWFNLDVGLEFCFYEGMGAYDKMWLQFVFPIYLVALVMALFVVCRLSGVVRGVFGHYLYPVLATVLLLIYTKVLRTVFLSMALTRLTCNGKTSHYWYMDPNVPFGGSRHMPLMVVAVLFLLFLIVPYTLFLLLFPLLQLRLLQRWRLVRWCHDKLKPITGVYGAPYHRKYQYWTGLLALQRFVLALVVTFNGNSNLALRVLVVMMVKLVLTLNYGQVYTGRLNRVLDTWFILSLMVTAAFAVNDNEWSLPTESEAVILLVLAIGLLIFMCLAGYHGYLHVYRPLCQRVPRQQRGRLEFKESSEALHVEEGDIANYDVVSDTAPSINDD